MFQRAFCTTFLIASLAALPLNSNAQAQKPPSPAPQNAQSGGTSTGGVHAAVHDAENRPITAGGFVDAGPVVFELVIA